MNIRQYVFAKMKHEEQEANKKAVAERERQSSSTAHNEDSAQHPNLARSTRQIIVLDDLRDPIVFSFNDSVRSMSIECTEALIRFEHEEVHQLLRWFESL